MSTIGSIYRSSLGIIIVTYTDPRAFTRLPGSQGYDDEEEDSVTLGSLSLLLDSDVSSGVSIVESDGEL